jgi:hypothetical protein
MGGKSQNQVTVRVERDVLQKIDSIRAGYKNISQRLVLELAVSALQDQIKRDGGKLNITPGAPGNGHADDACDAPGHCMDPIRLAAESRARYGSKGAKR